MKFDQAVLDRFTITRDLGDCLRATLLAYSATPLGMGYGHTRFASPTDAFRLLYVAPTLVTCVAETLVRDRFGAKKAVTKGMPVRQKPDHPGNPG